MSTVNGFGSMNQVSQLYSNTYKASKTAKSGETDRTAKTGDPSAAMRLKQTNRAEQSGSIQEGVKLSDGAKKVLDELKEKYGNMDFFVADNVSDEEAQEIMSRGNKEYSVLLDSETLEAMAKDDDTKAKYTGMIDEATQKLGDIKSELEESGAEVTNIGMKFDKDGTAKFFADIRKSNENYQKKTQEAREAAKKEEAKAEKAKEKKEKDEERIKGRDDENTDSIAPGYEKKARVSADTADELIEQIKNFDWTGVKATKIVQEGAKFDLTV